MNTSDALLSTIRAVGNDTRLPAPDTTGYTIHRDVHMLDYVDTITIAAHPEGGVVFTTKMDASTNLNELYDFMTATDRDEAVAIVEQLVGADEEYRVTMDDDGNLTFVYWDASYIADQPVWLSDLCSASSEYAPIAEQQWRLNLEEVIENNLKDGWL